MNDEPEQGGNAEIGEPEGGEIRRPTLVRRIFGLVVGLAMAYIVGLFLALFFWTGFSNPNGVALVSAALFLVFWLVLTIRLMKRA